MLLLLLVCAWPAIAAGEHTVALVARSTPPTIQFSSTEYSVSETGAVAIITVELNLGGGDPFNIYSVDYSTANGTATAGLDYVAQSGTLFFVLDTAATLETNATFMIPVLDDDLTECDETVQLTLSNPAFDAVLGVVSNAVLTIQDNESLERWVKRSPLGTAQPLYAVTFGNLLVAVGGQDFLHPGPSPILISPNGTDWTAVESGTDANLYGVTCGNGKFVAVGAEGLFNGRILVSQDGVTWSTSLAPTYELHGVTFGAGVFVAVGESGAVLTSPDGDDWTLRQIPYELTAVAYANNLFVALDYRTILTSTDGITWTPQLTNNSEGYLTGVAYGQGRFVVVSGGNLISSSADGIVWTEGPVASLNGVAYGNGRFVAVGSDSTFISTNGTDWEQGGAIDASGLTYANGMFVSVGAQGAIATSPDGELWTEILSPLTVDDLHRVIYAGGLFVAVGGEQSVFELGPERARTDSGVSVSPYATLLTSPDGVSWTRRSDNPWGDSGLNAVAYGNGCFVALGSHCGFRSCSAIVLTSPDGISWTNSVSFGLEAPLVGVAYGNGTFVAVGSSDIVTSFDAVTWSPQPPHPPLADVTFGDGHFVAVGESGTFISSEGWGWDRIDVCSFASVTYAHRTFVAVGGRIISTSPDGIVWTRRFEGDVDLNSVIWAAGAFVALSSTGAILTSPDGITWNCQSSPPGSSIAYGNGRLVLVGPAGLIEQTDAYRPNFRTRDLSRSPDGTMRLILDADRLHGTVLIETSGDLRNWTPLTTVTNFTGTIEFHDAAATNLPMRFYRAVCK
jgi:hypothetical protein